MQISKEIIKKLEKIAEYYSFENDICNIETALQIAINKELEYINEEERYRKHNLMLAKRIK